MNRLARSSPAARSRSRSAASSERRRTAWAIARLGRWEAGGNDLRNIAVFVAALFCAGSVYLGIAHLLRTPELADVVAALRRRLGR